MAKYYIQSGEVQFVVSAGDAEAAALFVLNHTINKMLPTDSSNENLNDQPSMKLVVSCLDLLDSEFHVSEIGFGHGEVAILDTEILLKKWCELLTAMNDLMNRIDGERF